MPKIIAQIFILIIIFIAMHETSLAADNTVIISGKIIFTCDANQSFMEKNYGHKYIKELPNGEYKTNLFGVMTEVIIKNSKNDIIGLVNTDKDGIFKVQVESSNFYTVSFDFLSKQHTKTISKDSLSPIVFDFGRLPLAIFIN